MEFFGVHTSLLSTKRIKIGCINHWAASPPSSAAFKRDAIVRRDGNESKAIANPMVTTGFNFEVDNDNRQWLQEGMRAISKVIDTFPDGHHKMAFVIGRFVKTHLDVLKLFSEDPDAPLRPKHFATEQEASVVRSESGLE